MNFTYYGHSCFAVELGGHALLFDPFITPNPQAGGIEIKSVRADFILVSHGPPGHLADAVAWPSGRVQRSSRIMKWRPGLASTAPQKSMRLITGARWILSRSRQYVNAIHSSVCRTALWRESGRISGGEPAAAIFIIQATRGYVDMKLIGESTRLTFAALVHRRQLHDGRGGRREGGGVGELRPDRGRALQHIPSRED